MQYLAARDIKRRHHGWTGYIRPRVTIAKKGDVLTACSEAEHWPRIMQTPAGLYFWANFSDTEPL